jgi:hypothetical protein
VEAVWIKQRVLSAVQAEFRNHNWDTFVDDPPSVAQGSKAIAVPGCSRCREKIQTVGQIIEHLASDVFPKALDSDGSD